MKWSKDFLPRHPSPYLCFYPTPCFLPPWFSFICGMLLRLLNPREVVVCLCHPFPLSNMLGSWFVSMIQSVYTWQDVREECAAALFWKKATCCRNTHRTEWGWHTQDVPSKVPFEPLWLIHLSEITSKAGLRKYLPRSFLQNQDLLEQIS